MRTNDAIQLFIASRRARGCSPSYEDWLTYTLTPLARTWPQLPTTPEAIELVLAELPRNSDETRYDHWVAIRLLYRWLSDRHGHPNAAHLIPKPIRRPKLPHTITPDQITRLLTHPRISRRDRALLTVLLDTGIRIGEAASMTWQGTGPSSIRVAGKTGQREVPILPTTARALFGLGSGEHVWVGRTGPLQVDALKVIVRRALARAGIKGSAHTLRHTFGLLYIQAGGDAFSLQRIMGHRDIETTKRYVSMNLADVKAQHQRFSPLAPRAAAAH